MVYTKVFLWIKKTVKKSHIAKVMGRPLRAAQIKKYNDIFRMD